jgi:hypothetical protein
MFKRKQKFWSRLSAAEKQRLKTNSAGRRRERQTTLSPTEITRQQHFPTRGRTGRDEYGFDKI